MAAFKFRLMSVLELRRHAERDQKDTLARERQLLAELMDESKRLLGELRFWSRQYLKNAEAGMSPPEAIRINAYLEELGRLLEENEKQAELQAAAVEKARLELIERMKERKPLDTLYDKQLTSFTELERVKEEHLVEEMVMSRLYQN